MTTATVTRQSANHAAFRTIDSEIMAAHGTLDAIGSLFGILSRRMRLHPSSETVEYLLERRETIAVHLGRAILLYAQTSGLDVASMAALRNALDLPDPEGETDA